MGMFDSWNNLKSYIPNNMISITPNRELVKKPLEEYNCKGELIGYSWTYGDSIIFQFNITGNVVDDLGYIESPAEYLKGKKIKLNFFNFKFDCIYSDCCEAGECIKFFLDPNISACFLRGIYYCSLSVVDDNQEVLTTLISPSDYILRVR